MPANFDLSKLKAPFPEKDIEWRVARSGGTPDKPWVQALAYVDARAVMDRLDEVCGPDNWKMEYHPAPGGTMCGLSLRIGDEWVTKWDGSDESDIEAFKGGISGSLKRAAVTWGIGRYLYNLPSNQYAQICEKHGEGARWAEVRPKLGQPFEVYWAPPRLPMWALVEEEQKKRRESDSRSPKVVAPAASAPVPAAVVAPKATAVPNNGPKCENCGADKRFTPKKGGAYYCPNFQANEACANAYEPVAV